MNTYGAQYVRVQAAPRVRLMLTSVESVDRWLQRMTRPDVRDALLDARLHLRARELVEEWHS